MKPFVLLLSVLVLTEGCLREPSPYHSRFAKSPGDNGFKIKISGDIEKYVPGELYTGNYIFIHEFSTSYKNIFFCMRY